MINIEKNSSLTWVESFIELKKSMKITEIKMIWANLFLSYKFSIPRIGVKDESKRIQIKII